MDHCNINIDKIFCAIILYKSRSRQYFIYDQVIYSLRDKAVPVDIVNHKQTTSFPGFSPTHLSMVGNEVDHH